MRVMLTGAHGQLGQCLRDRCPDAWHLIALDRSALDIADADAVKQCVAAEQPDWVINAAAYTAVDRAESEQALAVAVNERGAVNLAQATHAAGARLIHISTDYVFDGQARQPYTEHDAPTPINVYGRSKWLGEQAVLRAQPRALIVRTSGVYSEYGQNFVKTMLRLALQRGADAASIAGRSNAAATSPATAPAASSTEAPPLRVVADQTTCPTYAGDLADALIGLIALGEPPVGLYHYCGATPVSWHAFAQRIFDCARQLDPRFPVPGVEAITADAYSSAAARPAYSVLSCEKIKALGIPPRSLNESLPRVVEALLRTFFQTS